MKTNKILILVFLFFSMSVQAVELSKDTTDFNELARTRTYPGGADEDDLKVKDTINEPTLNVYKNNVDQDIVEELQKSKAATETE